MKIATYNIWNENDGVGSRFHALISEIIAVNADIIALQEVAVSFYQKAKEHLTLYPYSEFRAYLKTGNVPKSEKFFRCASHFDAGILEVFQGKRAQHSEKRAAIWVR